jgi:hypothetical protein
MRSRHPVVAATSSTAINAKMQPDFLNRSLMACLVFMLKVFVRIRPDTV